jgi:hypothetical protein
MKSKKFILYLKAQVECHGNVKIKLLLILNIIQYFIKREISILIN